jgi:5-formyltetrahydrofolate cyclo-ligase
VDPKAEKRALRTVLVQRILALDPDVRLEQQAVLTARFASLPGFANAATVLLYVSAFPEEIETGAMLAQTLKMGKRLLCPRVDRPTRRLRLFQVDDLAADLRPGTLGIPEPAAHCREFRPAQVDWVLVPGLAFDDRGYRLGRGAGHYDRLLPALRPDAPRWALAFDCQWVESFPVEPHDVPLDGIVTPSKTVSRPSAPLRSAVS